MRTWRVFTEPVTNVNAAYLLCIFTYQLPETEQSDEVPCVLTCRLQIG